MPAVRHKAGPWDTPCATQTDEFMIVSDVFDPALRLRSLDIAAAAMREPALV